MPNHSASIQVCLPGLVAPRAEVGGLGEHAEDLPASWPLPRPHPGSPLPHRQMLATQRLLRHSCSVSQGHSRVLSWVD